MQLPRVFLQVEVAAEALAADPAGERFLLVVCVHVERQVVDLVESLQTDMLYITRQLKTLFQTLSRYSRGVSLQSIQVWERCPRV